MAFNASGAAQGAAAGASIGGPWGAAIGGVIGAFGGGGKGGGGGMSYAVSSADGRVISGDWTVATSGSRGGPVLPFELLIVGGLVALLIWKKVK